MPNSNSRLLPVLAFGVPLGIYALFLGLSAIPFFQRSFLYAHKISSLLWNDVNQPEAWGFAKNQVTPFSLTTVDNQTLYAWHILPLPLYAQHEDTLAAQPSGFCGDITQTENFKLLRDDPTSHLIITFHGNAGHIAQAIRPAHYHSLTDTSSFHILAIDYRGFGHSTGTPTEAGLIIDAVTAITWAMTVAKVPADRIVLVGHSLGTAVASAATEYFANEGVDFAGVVLISPFSSLPEMLSGYAIAGWAPVLAPVRAWPWLLNTGMGLVVDKWMSADRLREAVRTVKGRGGRLRLSLVHARNDWDIPCVEDDKIFRDAVEGLDGSMLEEEGFEAEKKARTVERGEHAFVATWTDDDVVLRQELVPYGGHNDVAYSSTVVMAIMRSFGLVGETGE
ncbi:Alpha/Beta hydrolase protein [Cercophora scortea]|uniref:Alpha/Beta hydrolase protein n=1 Tax=Cercophora scortea TaxID=314031 RepID=A0AAE0I397_9PEZI|nr:Alpha/Beta hydrolase protein [Cercophora scortea]